MTAHFRRSWCIGDGMFLIDIATPTALDFSTTPVLHASESPALLSYLVLSSAHRVEHDRAALAWCPLVLSLLGAGAALVCPDGAACHDGSTCCEDVMGRYGCCPLPSVSPRSRRVLLRRPPLLPARHRVRPAARHVRQHDGVAPLDEVASSRAERARVGRDVPGPAFRVPGRHHVLPAPRRLVGVLPTGQGGVLRRQAPLLSRGNRLRPLAVHMRVGGQRLARLATPGGKASCRARSRRSSDVSRRDDVLPSELGRVRLLPRARRHVLLGPPPLLPSRHRVQLGRRHVRRGRGRTPRPGDPRRPVGRGSAAPLARRDGRRDDGERTRRADRPPAAAGSVLRGRLPPPPRRAHVHPPPLVPLPRTPRDPLARQSARRHAPGGRRRRQVRRQEQLRGGHYLLQAAHRGVGVLPARQGCVLR
ncbi:uncharacterized protein LOC133395231 [Phycodurus eques]|uniref:uncharacterized protein LOC133395231 n=1 Tax=Phycodurus eques TaxID=693459 RepID=UPI002ACDAF33|nr:uncharacterized protein LOC133395231 [Phycodurus eques]